jgi:hypothetical protein
MRPMGRKAIAENFEFKVIAAAMPISHGRGGEVRMQNNAKRIAVTMIGSAIILRVCSMINAFVPNKNIPINPESLPP